jgi:recombination associated protein RdgC
LGALRGSLTFSRFFVVGDLADDLPGWSLKRIRASASQPLDPDEDTPERHGWASVEDPFDTDLDHEKVFFNEYVVLSLRVDRWVVPGPLLKAHLREAEEKLLERKGMEKLGRKAKGDLKIMVVRKLRRQLVPVTRTVDLVWNLGTNVVLFFSHAKKTHELVQALFEKTFKAQLLLESPGTAASRKGLNAAQEDLFANLEPTVLTRAPGTRGAESKRTADAIRPSEVVS